MDQKVCSRIILRVDKVVPMQKCLKSAFFLMASRGQVRGYLSIEKSQPQQCVNRDRTMAGCYVHFFYSHSRLFFKMKLSRTNTSILKLNSSKTRLSWMRANRIKEHLKNKAALHKLSRGFVSSSGRWQQQTGSVSDVEPSEGDDERTPPQLTRLLSRISLHIPLLCDWFWWIKKTQKDIKTVKPINCPRQLNRLLIILEKLG